MMFTFKSPGEEILVVSKLVELSVMFQLFMIYKIMILVLQKDSTSLFLKIIVCDHKL